MLLKELGNLKMEQKEKVKYCNQRFNHILNNFSANTKPHNSITINYCNFSLPTSILQFIKRIVKQTLTKNYEEEITVEMDLHMIRFIADDEPTKDSKGTGKRSQTSVSKAKEKENINIEILTCTIKAISNELEELKQRSSETTMSSKTPKFNMFRRTETSTSSSN